MSYVYIYSDCFDWMRQREENSITAIVTEPPYGVKEYTEPEIEKKRQGKGGIWRIPPAFDGHTRQAVPRFSVINDDPREREAVYRFFFEWGMLALKVLVPGGHAFIASTPLLSDVLSKAMRDAGFERRGEIIRTVSTLRGGDRPKGAEKEFEETCVIPKGVWEPWGLYRKPLSEKTVAANLRKWHAGALRRSNAGTPFSDLIESGITPQAERKLAPHPSIKPQAFLRKIVFASLPLGDGVVLDPFAGSGSTLAAANYYNYDCIGVEKDKDFYAMGLKAIPALSELYKTGTAICHKKASSEESEATQTLFAGFLSAQPI